MGQTNQQPADADGTSNIESTVMQQLLLDTSVIRNKLVVSVMYTMTYLLIVTAIIITAEEQ